MKQKFFVVLIIFSVSWIISSMSLKQSWHQYYKSSIKITSIVASVCLPICSNSLIATANPIEAALKNSEITYSNNARNLKRISEGDFSQGRKDLSKSERAFKRRVVEVCKSSTLRAKYVGGSESDCILKSMGSTADMKFVNSIIEKIEIIIE